MRWKKVGQMDQITHETIRMFYFMSVKLNINRIAIKIFRNSGYFVYKIGECD